MAWTRTAVQYAIERHQAGVSFEEIAREMRRRRFKVARRTSFSGEHVRRKLVEIGAHTPKQIRRGALDEWLKRHIEVDPNSSCHIWTGRIDRKGYGTIGDGRLAHRAVWEEIALRPLPDGVELHHTCRNRGCVNVDHLLPIDSAKLHAILHKLEAQIEDLTVDQLADAVWLFTDEEPADLPSRVGARDLARTKQLTRIAS